MRLVFAGCGSAFTTSRYYQSNVIVEENNQKLLIDCGSDARHSLREQGYSHQDINAVYLTHCHADHIGGMEWLGFSTYFTPDCPKPRLYIVEDLIPELWNALKAGLQSLPACIAQLDTYFDVYPLSINCSDFIWNDIHFTPFQTKHFWNGTELRKSYGLFIRHKSNKILFSGDTLLWDKNMLLYEHATEIFHDCETMPNPSNCHAHYNDLKNLDSKIKKKMWLYHYQPHPKQDPESDGFKGFVRKGNIYQYEQIRV